MSDPITPTPTTPAPQAAPVGSVEVELKAVESKVETEVKSGFGTLVKKYGLPVAIVIVAVGAFVFLHLL